MTETFPPEVNGVAMTLERLTLGLVARGHAVTVICPQRPDRAVDDLAYPVMQMPGGPIPRYPGLRFGWPAHGHLRRAWKDSPPDLVHVATEGPLGWSAARTAQQMGLPLVTSFHTNFHGYGRHYGYGWMQSWVYRWLRAHHARAARTFVPSEDLQGRLAADGFGHLSLLARGVDTRLFDPAKRDRELRRQWGARDDTPVLLYVGRLAAEKNIDLTIRAWLAFREIQPEARLVLVGEGPERERLRRSHPGLVFCGLQRGESLARHYASADIFPFASSSETFGNVVTEAMASGLVVLAYQYAAAARHIRDGVHGRTVPFEDAEAFVTTARALAREPQAWPALREAARKAARGISWDSVLDHYEREAMAVIATAGRGASAGLPSPAPISDPLRP